jgi:hypothetical protein
MDATAKQTYNAALAFKLEGHESLLAFQMILFMSRT